jgi:nicotinamidase-related amidase/type 1 glutamine amidotransferase
MLIRSLARPSLFRRIITSLIFALACLVLVEPCATADDNSGKTVLSLTTRSRAKQPDGSFRIQLRPVDWNARQTAIVVCDMWDGHYCRAAEARVAEMAPRMNEVLEAARKRGVLIIHSPSGCMDKYQGTPQRKLAQQAPPFKPKVPLQSWCKIDKAREGDLPIDDSVPCEDENPRPAVKMFSKQIETLKIAEGDAITDSAEAFNLIEQRGIKNVILMGVHTNMCVLGRPFGIRQMVLQGKNVVLMRDMTDAMYSPKMKPYVSHFRGTELVVEHIERHWCPTIASTDFTGKAPFRFKDDARPRVVLVVGGSEYNADETMPELAHELTDRWGCYCDVLLGRGKDKEYTIPGLAALEKADCLVLYLRRRALWPQEMDAIRNYLKAGKPLVALRTASHGFAAGEKAPSELSQWPKFDIEVLGCHYHGHGPDGTDVAVVSESLNHPILAGVDTKPWRSTGALYNSSPLDKTATVLLTGSQQGRSEPIAWTRSYHGARVFYTSLGHKEDFKQPQFRRMLVNAVGWGMGKTLVETKRP